MKGETKTTIYYGPNSKCELDGSQFEPYFPRVCGKSYAKKYLRATDGPIKKSVNDGKLRTSIHRWVWEKNGELIDCESTVYNVDDLDILLDERKEWIEELDRRAETRRLKQQKRLENAKRILEDSRYRQSRILAAKHQIDVDGCETTEDIEALLEWGDASTTGTIKQFHLLELPPNPLVPTRYLLSEQKNPWLRGDTDNPPIRDCIPVIRYISIPKTYNRMWRYYMAQDSGRSEDA